MNGQGTIVYPDGTSYDGQWKDGEYHGEGVEMGTDGKK